MNPKKCQKKKDEWYTPEYILNPVRKALGGQIEWDLASCEKANAIVKSRKYFSKDYPFQLNYKLEVFQGFWCNPPFSVTAMFAETISACADRGAMLTNANTSSGWWQQLAGSANHVVFLSQRVSFLDSETLKPVTGNPTGQTIFLWKLEPGFFEEIGIIMSR